MIRVRELSKRYGERTAVEGASFDVKRGEIVGFLGPNGAGKTTTLRMITGFLTPTAGSILVDGIDAVEAPLEARKRIGYMPEGVPLYPEMRVREYMRYRAKLKGVGRAQLKSRVDAALEQASVTDVADRIIGQLSKGYRQRVGLADALVADPPLLILDEPTSGLDPNQIRQVRDLVKSFQDKKTVFVSTHILPEVEATCSRVVIVHRGRVVGEGPPASLRVGPSAQMVTVVVRVPKEATDSEHEAPTVVETLLHDVAGVRSVAEVSEPEPGVIRARLTADGEASVLEHIFEAVSAKKLRLRELSRGSRTSRRCVCRSHDRRSPAGAEAGARRTRRADRQEASCISGHCLGRRGGRRGMNAIWTIAAREIQSFFVSPIAYVVLTVWLFFQGLSLYIIATWFADYQYDLGSVGSVTFTPLTLFFGEGALFHIVLLVVVPLMTMRLISEEFRAGTFETLLTAPVTEVHVVLGKYLAAIAFWVTLWVPSLLYVWIMSQHGSVDWGVVGASYLGVFGLGLYFMALGLLMSCVARNQLVAGALTFMATGSLFLLGLMGRGGSFSSQTTQEVLNYVSMWTHMETFARGIVDSRYLTFDVTVAALAVLLAIRVLQSRRVAA